MLKKKNATGIDDCTYNSVKQLSKKLELVWHIDDYIKDAKRCNHKRCLKVFEIIKKDELAHIEMLKKIIERKIKKGELK